MNYIYAPVISEGVRELAEALKAKRLVRFDGLNFVNKGKIIEFTKQDAVICWGYHVPPVPNAVTLNSSYDCVNQLFLNKQLHRIAANRGTGITVFELQEMDPLAYQTELAAAKAVDWKIKKQPPSGMIVFEEFENYGSRYYNWSRRGNVHIFNGEVALFKQTAGVGTIIPKEDREMAKLLLKACGFDFGKVSFGVASSTFVGLKVLTAPALDKNLVDVYAKNLLSLIETKQAQISSLNNMKELMEL